MGPLSVGEYNARVKGARRGLSCLGQREESTANMLSNRPFYAKGASHSRELIFRVLTEHEAMDGCDRA